MPGETSSEVDLELLIMQMAEKEEDALRQFLEAVGGKIKGFLMKLYRGVLKEQEIDAAVNATAFNVWRFADRYTTAKGTPKTWIIRIARNAAISILRGENRNRTEESPDDPHYDPADHCEDDPQEVGSNRWRAHQMNDIIEHELTGLEQAVARADLAAGESTDAGRLAALHGTSKQSIYTTRSKYRAKIRKRVLEREASKDRPKGQS